MTTEEGATNERTDERDETRDERGADAGSEFDPSRFRTLTSMRRDTDDRMVAGVCAGVARYLNIDPIVVRVVVACLAFVGFAGVVLYVAAWLLVPEEGDDESLVDQHLPETVDREQVRRIGLFVAAAIAAASMLGAGFTFVGASIPIALAALALFYVFIVVPYNKRHGKSAADRPAVTPTADVESSYDADSETRPLGTAPDAGPPTSQQRVRNPRRDYGILLGVTATVIAVLMAGMAAYSNTAETIDWPYFPLAAMVVVGIGMLVGSFYGNGRPLALLGFPLAAILLLTTILPTYSIGDERHEPALASDVADSYEQGIGNFVLDLTEITDPAALDGRTVELEQGVGSLEVVVPDGLGVDVEADTDAGSLKILDRSTDGAPVSLHYVDPSSNEPVLHLDVEQTIGEVRVTRR